MPFSDHAADVFQVALQYQNFAVEFHVESFWEQHYLLIMDSIQVKREQTEKELHIRVCAPFLGHFFRHDETA